MSNKILKYVRAVVFIAIVVGLVKCMDYAMMPSGYIRYIIHEADNADTDEGYDNIIIGASHARSAINPVKLDEAGASDNAFNLAIPGETVTDSYYLLMESDRHNNVKRVIYDLDYQYWCNYAEREFEDCFIYTWLPFSNVKLKYIADNLLTKDFRTVYSKRWAYEISPSAIMNNLKVKSSAAYRNYSMDAVEIHDAGGPYAAKGFFYRDMKMDSLVHLILLHGMRVESVIRFWIHLKRLFNIVRRIILNWYALHHLLRRQHQLTVIRNRQEHILRGFVKNMVLNIMISIC